jgi:hypothetical protein
MADLIAETSKENDRREIFLHPPFLTLENVSEIGWHKSSINNCGL